MRAKVAQGGMTALVIVEAHHVLKNNGTRFSSRIEDPISTFAFERRPEAFNRGIVEAIALGIISLKNNDFMNAVDLFKQSLAIWRKINLPVVISNGLWNIAWVILKQGNP